MNISDINFANIYMNLNKYGKWLKNIFRTPFGCLVHLILRTKMGYLIFIRKQIVEVDREIYGKVYPFRIYTYVM